MKSLSEKIGVRQTSIDIFRCIFLSNTLQIAVLALPSEYMDLVQNINFVSTEKGVKA